MPLTVFKARELVAKTLQGGANDSDVLSDAMDALSLALSELNFYPFEFNLTALSFTTTAGVGDYTITGTFFKTYSVRYNNERTLPYISQRIDDYTRPVKENQEPLGYNLFPEGSVSKIRLVPTPATSGHTVAVNAYRRVTVATATGGNIDLPEAYHYWPVYRAKAILLSDRNALQRAMLWQQRADQLLREMKWSDVQHPDEQMGLVAGSAVNQDNRPVDHGWRWVQESYGF